ncbi:MAG TPA: FAD-dependent oxidoreductase [Stellaceae bacterium]|nr:FAD-dependent oxidoreductase [Stellaceae bacterium]
MSDKHFVIVGAGHAGGRAAEALRATGHKGRVTLLGAERHPPYERPPLSKELLAGQVAVEKTFIRPPAWYGEQEIDLRLGNEAVAIDRAAQRVRMKDGTDVPYDALMVTTGARPRVLRLPGGEGPRILYLRDIDDSLRLRELLVPGVRFAVIGAGFIGLEVAATAKKRGASVVVLELAPHVLARVCPPEIGDYVADLHRRNGVEIRTGVGVTALEDKGGEVEIVTSDGERIAADYVAVGIGAQPNTEIAAAAGLAVEDGIKVDEFGRTSDPLIYAAGDVTRHLNPLVGRHIRLEAWQNAQNQAIAVAKVMSGGEVAFAEVPWFWTDQFDMNLQMAGAPDRWDQLVFRGEPAERSFTVFHLADGKPVAVTTVNAPRDMRFGRMLIQRGTAVDPALLADKAVKLQDLAR